MPSNAISDVVSGTPKQAPWEADLVRHLNARLAAPDNLKSFLESLLNHSAEVLGSAHGVVMVFSNDLRTARCAASLRNGLPVSEETLRAADVDVIAMADHGGHFDALSASEDGVFFDADDPMFPPGTRAYFVQWGIASICDMAMRIGGSVIGWLSVAYPTRQRPDAERLARMRILANQLAVAVEASRLGLRALEAAVSERRQAEAQHRVAQLARANRSLKKSLGVVGDDKPIGRSIGHMMTVIAEQVGSRVAALCLRGESQQHLTVYLAVIDGALHTEDAATSLPSELLVAFDRVERAMLDAKEPVTLRSSPADDGDIDEASRSDEHVVTWLGIPLLQGTRMLGGLVFKCWRQHASSAEEIEVLQTHGHQIALALRLAQASAVLEEKSRSAAVSAERSRLARDLHDTLAQGLTGILMHLQASQRATDCSRSQAHIDAALVGAQGVFNDARRAVEAMDHEGNDRKSRDLAKRIAEAVRTTFTTNEIQLDVEDRRSSERRIDTATEGELLRIIQEAATNTLKHARARRFSVVISDAGDRLCIVVTDDGTGFAQGSGDSGGFGLIGMRERGERIGGIVRIESEAGVGTRIIIDCECARDSSSPLAGDAKEPADRSAA